jgi:hypothetical protein
MLFLLFFIRFVVMLIFPVLPGNAGSIAGLSPGYPRSIRKADTNSQEKQCKTQPGKQEPKTSRSS